MNQYPLVSVITPSYNQGQFIERTILSVLNQDYPRVEYIVVDGASSDGTVEILKKYDCKIRWVSEPDQGQADAINKGFRMCQGDILAYLNSDDTYCPGAIREAVQALQNNSYISMVYGDYHIIDYEDNIIESRREIHFDFNIFLYVFNYIPQPTVFFRRSVWEQVGPFDVDLRCVIDTDYWIRVRKRGIEIRHVPFYMANFRLHKDSKTWKDKPVFRQEIAYLWEKHQELFKQRNPIRIRCPQALHLIYRLKRIYLKTIQRCYF
jgi:glycosyltransferase involved in cell wall biosynthesis